MFLSFPCLFLNCSLKSKNDFIRTAAYDLVAYFQSSLAFILLRLSGSVVSQTRLQSYNPKQPNANISGKYFKK